MATLETLTPGGQTDVWGPPLVRNLDALNAELAETVHKTGAETIDGVKTFTVAPVLPASSIPVGAIDAEGVTNETTVLHGDGVWRTPASDANSGTANTLGTPNNPVTDPARVRPTGLTIVWWNTSVDPTNWVTGDINMQAGT